jgi:hypothetical protein
MLRNQEMTMSIKDFSQGMTSQAGGPNPHFRPPVMRWNRVEVVGVRGLVFGIVADANGILTLSVKMGGGTWREGGEPIPDTVCVLADPAFVFQVVNDERGPAVGHEYEPDGDGGCKACHGG